MSAAERDGPPARGGVEHPVVFVHIAVPALAPAAAFYRAALGWSTEEVLDAGGRVVMVRCASGAKPNVGLVPGTARPGGTALYVLCDDLDAAASAWVAAGGAVGESEAFVGLGDRVVATDPWGNEVALWSWFAGRGWRPAPG